MALATACLWGLDAQALGLGRLSVQSALGEALRAEIDVTTLSPEEAATLRLRVAPPESYRAAGVEYNAVLPDTQVQLLRRANGQPFLRLTSNRAVVEPFVDVILEMNWSSGRLVREYTMLFDPPATRTAQAAPPPAPAAVAPVISAAPAPMPAPARPPAAAPAPAPAPIAVAAPRPAPVAPLQAAAPAPAGAEADNYRVRSGDTLSGIAQRYPRNDVSLDQMLVALFRANPAAFTGENMNRLKAGAVLSLPSADNAKQTADPAAREVIRAQSADFAAYRQQLAAGVATAKTDQPSRQAKGSVQASVQDNKQAAAAPPDKLTLSQGAVKASAPDAQLSKQTEQKDAATRVAELSRNVEELKRLQGEASGAKAAVPAGTAPAATTSAMQAASAPTMAPAAVPAPAAAVAAAPASAPGVVAAAPAAAPRPMPAPPAPVAPPAKPSPMPAAAQEPGMLETWFDNPLVLPGAGVLLALLAGFGIYRLRGRLRKDAGETSFLESRLQPDSFFGASGGQRIDTRDAASSTSSSSMTYSLSQLDAIGDVDPVAEADVYLAYGRDLQAEEILKEAMRSTPDRLAIRTKLLEVYAKRRDTKGFELLASQLFAQTDGIGEDWAKAQEMGRQIDPENPLYAPGGEPDLIVREGGRVVEPLDATTLPQSVMPTPPRPGPIDSPESLDLDGGLDLDLDFAVSAKAPLDLPPPGPAESTRPFTTDASMSGVPGFSLDVEEPAAAGTSLSGASLDFDLGELSLDVDAAKPVAPTLDSSASTSPEPADDFPSSLPAFEISDFDQDPLARKLELAEEFRQIGDMEGARDLLEEVVASADGTLKSKAQGMLDTLH
jgi:pilus assembly protein FimV